MCDVATTFFASLCGAADSGRQRAGSGRCARSGVREFRPPSGAAPRP